MIKRIIQKIKREVSFFKSRIKDVGFRFGVIKKPILSVKKSMLLYHGIDTVGNLQFNTKFISQERLREQLSYLKKNADIVSIDAYFKTKEENITRPQICITFDDGFENNLTHALPVLEELNIPATIFITTAQQQQQDVLWADYLDLSTPHTPKELTIGNVALSKKRSLLRLSNGVSYKAWLKNQPWKRKEEMFLALKDYEAFWKTEKFASYWRLLNESQLKTLANHPLITLGTHGVTHDNLGSIDIVDAKKELVVSKKYLEQITEQPINFIAFPDGSYTRALIFETENLGYIGQLAVDYLFDEDNTDSRIENRLGINPYTSWDNQVIAINKGGY
jgi:peptidoglycan/xylan/chitin deacetylase (PgdA/CDA1 family)